MTQAGIHNVPRPRLSFAMLQLPAVGGLRGGATGEGRLLVFGGVSDEMEEEVVHSTFLNDAWVLRVPPAAFSGDR